MREFREFMIEQLADQVFAAGYLNAILTDGDQMDFLRALKYVADGRGGMSRLAAKTRLNRANLYRIFSGKGNPEIQTMGRILDAMGFRLAVAAASKGSKRRIKTSVKPV